MEIAQEIINVQHNFSNTYYGNTASSILKLPKL